MLCDFVSSTGSVADDPAPFTLFIEDAVAQTSNWDPLSIMEIAARIADGLA